MVRFHLKLSNQITIQTTISKNNSIYESISYEGITLIALYKLISKFSIAYKYRIFRFFWADKVFICKTYEIASKFKTKNLLNKLKLVFYHSKPRLLRSDP